MGPGVDRRAFLSLGARAGSAVALGSALGPLGRTALSGAQVPAPPRIITRPEWGADESIRRSTPIFHPVRKFVVHHTATPNGGDPIAQIQAIYRSHLVRDGGIWKDLGYNYVIDPWGRIYEGRYARTYQAGEVPDGEDRFGRGVRGSHAGEANPGSLGIALLGTFEAGRPTEAAVNALVTLIAWKCARHGLDPLGSELYRRTDGAVVALPTIIGHRDVRSTACPGHATYAMLDEIRRRVATQVPPAASTGPGGYRLLHGDGTFSLRGNARDAGDLPRFGVIVGAASLAVSPRGGFWVLDRMGGVHGFGGPGYYGSVPELIGRGLVLGGTDAAQMAATPTGRGYWVLDREGGVFSFGDAGFHGSVPALRAEGVSVGFAEAVALARAPRGDGYWVLDREGGVFAFGDAPFHGSVPALRASGVEVGQVSAVDLQPSATGRGYWVLDREGGVFAFGDAPFHGSVPAAGSVGADTRRLVPTSTGNGYYVVCRDGSVLAFGDARFHRHGPHLDTVDLVPT